MKTQGIFKKWQCNGARSFNPVADTQAWRWAPSHLLFYFFNLFFLAKRTIATTIVFFFSSFEKKKTTMALLLSSFFSYEEDNGNCSHHFFSSPFLQRWQQQQLQLSFLKKIGLLQRGWQRYYHLLLFINLVCCKEDNELSLSFF